MNHVSRNRRSAKNPRRQSRRKVNVCYSSIDQKSVEHVGWRTQPVTYTGPRRTASWCCERARRDTSRNLWLGAPAVARTRGTTAARQLREISESRNDDANPHQYVNRLTSARSIVLMWLSPTRVSFLSAWRSHLADNLSSFQTTESPDRSASLNGARQLVKFTGPLRLASARLLGRLIPRRQRPIPQSFAPAHSGSNKASSHRPARNREHRPVADEEVHIVLFEPAGTLNTGDAHDRPHGRDPLTHLRKTPAATSTNIRSTTLTTNH